MKLSLETLSKVHIGAVTRSGSGSVVLPITVEDSPLHLKTVKGRVVSYDKETHVVCVSFENESFLAGIHAFNDMILEHVAGVRQKVYGPVSEADLNQIYRPFVISQHVFFYTWDARMVKKDGTEDPDFSLDDLPGCDIKCSFTVRGVTLQPNIFGAPLELDCICVTKVPKKAVPEPVNTQLVSFSDDDEEEEPSIFQGIVPDSQKELTAIPRP